MASKQRGINHTARDRGEDVRAFILKNVDRHPTDISKRVASHFQITRQAVHKHLSRLVLDGSLTETGRTRGRSYALAPQAGWNQTYPLEATLGEDVVWMRDIRPELGQLPDNALRIWQHGFTQMFNNAIDHSEGTMIRVEIRRTAANTEMIVADDGVGIFRKIQSRMGLLDERHAIFELSKGKLTTDPTRHTGEAIFFTSRIFDSFDIAQSATGTTVWMRLSNRTNRTTKKIFDQYVSGENYDFSRTVVPVVLAQYAGDPLVSRSQAKRVLARVDLFHTVVFDFSGVTSIGQAFADEIFRVFATAHPDMELLFVHASVAVGRLIARARSTAGANVRSHATGKRRS